MGAVVTPPLPSMLSEVSRTSRAPSLHGHCPASSLRRAHPSPSRRPPASHRWLWGPPDSAAFAVGRGGLLQLLDVSSSPCRRSHPVGACRRIIQVRRPIPPSPLNREAQPPQLEFFGAATAFTSVPVRGLTQPPCDGF